MFYKIMIIIMSIVMISTLILILKNQGKVTSGEVTWLTD